MSSPASTPRPHPTGRLAGGRLALAHDGQRVALAAATPDGGVADVQLFGAAAQGWAARVSTVLRAHPPGADVTPAELRTPWARGDDGEPALAIERTSRGPHSSWRVLVRAGAREVAIDVAEPDVVELLHRLAGVVEPARDAG